MIKSKRLLIVLLGGLCLLMPLASRTINAKTDNDNEILFISSYSYDFPPVERQISGIKKAIGSNALIHYVFMDTKNVDVATAETLLSKQLSVILNKTKYDVLIVGDDAAFNYALKYRSLYFKNLPIVYEGINSTQTIKSIENDPLITGVSESYPLKETIKSALDLQPEQIKLWQLSIIPLPVKLMKINSMALLKLFPNYNLKHLILLN